MWDGLRLLQIIMDVSTCSRRILRVARSGARLIHHVGAARLEVTEDDGN